MSRNPINGESLGSHLRKGMENMTTLTIVDPGKLRVPFGGVGGSRTPRKPSWMTTVVSDSSLCQTEANGPCETLDMPTPPPHTVKQPRTETEGAWEVHGWALSSGYSLFGLSLALCNILAQHHASRVCTAMSPVPSLCLLLQSLSVVKCSRHAALGSVGLLLAACVLPSACVFWSLYLAIPLILVSAFSAFCCVRNMDAVAWICLCGACLASLLALPAPMQLLEPRWGATVAIFCACVLCFIAGLGVGRVSFIIKSV